MKSEEPKERSAGERDVIRRQEISDVPAAADGHSTQETMSAEQLQPRCADRFRCIGPCVEESCCQGRETYVDKATYKKLGHALASARLPGGHIENEPDARNNFQYARIKFPANNRCPFLADDNLCNIQKDAAAFSLSKTCVCYPRALARFDGKMQRALSSCPEAARIVLLNPQLLPAHEGRYQQFVAEGLRQITSSAADMAARQLRALLWICCRMKPTRCGNGCSSGS